MLIILFPDLRDDRRIVFRNLSGSIDIRIAVYSKKDHVISSIRTKLNDQSITDIINYNVHSDPDIQFDNIIIRNTDRIKILEQLENITCDELRSMLLQESNLILLNDFEFIKTILQYNHGNTFHEVYPLISDRLKDEISLIGNVITYCEYIKYTSERIRSDRDEIGYLIGRCYREKKYDNNTRRIFIRSDIIYSNLSDELKHDIDIIREVYRYCECPHDIGYNIPTEIRNNRDILLSNLREYLHWIYRYLNDSLKHDIEILNSALATDKNKTNFALDVGAIYRSIPDDILDNKQYVIEVIRLYGDTIYQYLPQHIKFDKQVIKEVLLTFKDDFYDADKNEILKVMPDNLRDDKEFISDIILICSAIYDYISDTLKLNKDIITIMLNKDSGDQYNNIWKIQFDQLPHHDQITLFDTDPRIFRYLSDEVKDIKSIAYTAIKHNICNIRYTILPDGL
jgi:hypothetical protein